MSEAKKVDIEQLSGVKREEFIEKIYKGINSEKKLNSLKAPADADPSANSSDDAPHVSEWRSRMLSRNIKIENIKYP
eukprot:Nk52_evm3s375 gene=Nk52_evmTU3s375